MELKQYIAPLLKWWWLIAGATLIAAGASYFAVSQQPQTYQARVKLLIGRFIDDPNPSNIEFSVSQQLAAFYTDIANTRPVREQTMNALGMTSLPEYIVRPLATTQLIEIVVTDTIPERAQLVANELANQLILQSPTSPLPEEQERQTFIDEQLVSLQTNIQETQDEIAAKQDELKDLVSALEITESQNQISALQNKLNTLQSNYASLLSSTEGGATNTVRVIDPAAVPGAPIGPNIEITVLTAAAIGFVLAAAAGYFLEYLDDTIKTSEQVERIADLPVLAGIRQIKSKESKSKLITLEEPHSPVSEAFRVLRLGIQYSHVDNPSQTLLITSPNPTDGKSMAAANLSVVLAQTGYKVLLVDADLRRPVQHTIFGLNNKYGLTSLLLQIDSSPTRNEQKNDALIEELIQTTAEPGLSVLTSGLIPPYPSELLSSLKMKVVLTSLTEKYDYLILDSSPVLPVTDAIILSTQVDSVILLVNTKTTRQNELKQVIKHLREVDSNLLGVVMNRIPQTRKSYNLYYKRQTDYQEESEIETNSQPTSVQLKKSNGFLGKGQREEQI